MKYNFVFILSLIVIFSCNSNEAKEKKAISIVSTKTSYQLAIVEKGGVTTAIKLPAQLAAYQQISIFPKVNGYVKKVYVDIGSKVIKGSLLMVLEAPELEQAALQAKEKFAKANADYSIDKEHYLRYLEASKTAGAISPLDLSSLKGKMEADKAVSNAAKANWQMQQTIMGYLSVTAPFTGVITDRNVHPGALVSASEKDKPMLELKQINKLRLQVDIPEGLAATIKEKDSVSFIVSALQGKRMTGIINRKSMNVNTQYRNERIEVDVMNNDQALSAGMYADVELKSKGTITALFVPKSALVISTERKYVLLSKDGKITKTDVSTGNATMEKIEVYGHLNAGDSVIVKANDEIKEQQ